MDYNNGYVALAAIQTHERVQAQNEIGYGSPEDVPGPLVTIRYNPDNLAQFIIPQEQLCLEYAVSMYPHLSRLVFLSLIACGTVK